MTINWTNNQILSKKRKGTNDDPFIQIEESLPCVNGKTVLSEVPNQFQRVIVNYSEEYIPTKNYEIGDLVYYEVNGEKKTYECILACNNILPTNTINWKQIDFIEVQDNNRILNKYDYYVDYLNCIIHHNPYFSNKSLIYKYLGEGLELIPATKVWTKANGNEVTETLQGLINNGSEAIEALDELGGLIVLVDEGKQLETNLTTDISVGNTLHTDLQNDIVDADISKTNLEISITNSQTAKTSLDSSISNSDVKKIELDTSINNADSSKISLDSSISNANTKKNELDNSINVATIKNSDLESNVTIADVKKSDLDSSVFEANNIHDIISNPTTGTIKQATDKNAELGSTVDLANTTKSNLDTSITNANIIKDDLNTSVTDANNINNTLSNATTGTIKKATDINTSLNSNITNATDKNTTLSTTISNANSAQTTLNGAVQDGQNKIQEMDSKISEATDKIAETEIARQDVVSTNSAFKVMEVYNPNKDYIPLNKVQYEGSTYQCIIACKGIEPTNVNNWILVAAKGVVDNINWSDVQGKPTTFEYTTNKGKVNGYAGLDVNGKVPLEQLPDISSKKTFVVASIAERDALTGLNIGDDVVVLNAGDGSREGYIWDGTQYLKMSDTDWENISLDWSNISNKPTSTVTDIDDAVSLRHNNSMDHTHSNKSVLDATTASYTTAEQTKLAGVEAGANKYTHPVNHPASIITQDANNRFVSDTEKSTWNAKASTSVATTSANGLMSSTDKIKLNGIATGANKTTIINNLIETTTGKALDATQGKTLNDRIGILSNLTTTVKDTIVGAINEVNTKVIINNTAPSNPMLNTIWIDTSV